MLIVGSHVRFAMSALVPSDAATFGRFPSGKPGKLEIQ